MRHILKSLIAGLALVIVASAAQASYLGNGPFNIGQWSGTSLGVATNWGTAPTGTAVIGVNANVLAMPAIGLNTTPSIANGNGVVPTQGGAVLSATNGGYQNILQGNAVLSATNGVFSNILQGNAVLSTSNPIFITGTGTAGTAATNPITVQGIASMTPLLVNPGTAASWAVGALGSSVPSNGFYNSLNVGGTLRGWTAVNPTGTVYAGQIDLASVGGTSITLGSAASSASIPVVLASNQTAADPCMFQAKTNVAIATSAGNLQLVAPSSGKKVYICSAHVVAAAAAVLNIIEGTGAACVTANEAAIWGSTTAASGESYAANGGMTYGNGGGTVGHTATASNGICLLQSGTVALAGNIEFVQQ
jgi:hypothetical protein